ncbi:MAG: NAD+ synthase [Candidatus Cloacimonetes bacterium]|nr:NAD+ synthase [Candidatus Cloacimonadota bacterium]MBS3766570.1 NAD+ synthase [Candidatus Cloacimonadota bacterium]
MRQINLDKNTKQIKEFIKDYIHNAGKKKGILGLSGGLDSSVVAHLAKDALGKDNLIGVLLPYEKSSSDSLKHGKMIAEKLDIKYIIRDISPMVNSYFDEYAPKADKLRRGNFMARVRMSVIYDLSAAEKALVLGTGNKTELYLGYITQYGDSACAIEPIGHLYKTEVWKLAEKLGVPQEIIEKKPSADLWQNQTDEKELGITYKKADEILYLILEKKLSITEIVSKGFTEDNVKKVLNLMNKSQFKRSMPPSLESKK